MPRVSAKLPNRDNSVIARLKSGKGNVSGLKMLVAVDGIALVPVEVTGLDFYARGDSSRSVSVRVNPIGGHGHIWVAPGELIDNNKESIALHNKKCEAYDRVRKMTNSRSDRERRSEILNIRSEMTEAQKKEFATRIADRIGDKASGDPVAAINKMCGEYECRRVAELAVCIRYGIESEDSDY